MSTREAIQDFLAQRRIAFVGLSHNPRDFSRALYKDLVARGYEVVPVHPDTAAIDGATVYARVQDIPAPVDGALLLTSPAVTRAVVEDCIAAGIKRVWMYRAAGEGAVDPEAVARCRREGVRVVDGECPYMYLEHPGFLHAAHGIVRKLTGRYPRHDAPVTA